MYNIYFPSLKVHAQIKDELPKIEMPRTQLSNTEIITIMPKHLGSRFCVGYEGGRCDGIGVQCCDGLRCTLPFFGETCQFTR